MNMFIWKGYGFLGVLIPAFFLVLVQILVTALFQNPDYFNENGWPKLVIGLVSAPLIWYVGKRLNKTKETHHSDKKTGEETKIKAKHSLFFIPLEYWAFIVGISGIIYALPS